MYTDYFGRCDASKDTSEVPTKTVTMRVFSDGSTRRHDNSLVAPESQASGDWNWQRRGGIRDEGDHDSMPLQRITSQVRFPQNRTIFNEGDEAAYTYRVNSGVVRLCKHTVQGRRIVLHFLFLGDFFGFRQPGAYSFTAEAVNDVALTCYPQRQLESLAERDPSVRDRLRSLTMNRLLAVQDHLLLLGCLGAEGRLAAFLTWLSEQTRSNEMLRDVPMGRQDIADYLGLTVETVCRAFSKLKRADRDAQALQ
jgi:CRP/FNR family nitrogen fixation transcriptional regulator